jgi:hypothetical protein
MKFRIYFSLRVPCRSITSRHHPPRQRPPAHQDGSSPSPERPLTFVVKRTPDIPSLLIQPNNPQTNQGLNLCAGRPRYPRLWPLLHRHHPQRSPSPRITSEELGRTAGTVEVGVGKAIRRNRGSGSHWHGEDDCQQCTSSTSPFVGEFRGANLGGRIFGLLRLGARRIFTLTLSMGKIRRLISTISTMVT